MPPPPLPVARPAHSAPPAPPGVHLPRQLVDLPLQSENFVKSPVPPQEVAPEPTPLRTPDVTPTLQPEPHAPALIEAKAPTPNEHPGVKSAIQAIASLAGITNGQGVLETGESLSSKGDSPGQIEGQVAKRGIRTRVEPRYPENARRTGAQADVELLFWVDPDGNVISVEPETKSGEFDESAMVALRSWKFAPLDPRFSRKDQWGKVTMKFRLEH